MKININKKAVGGRIKQIRLNKGYTLESFGKLFNAKKGNVQSWEKGNALPNKERLLNISKIANLTVNELLYGSVNEFTQENLENILINTYGGDNGKPMYNAMNIDFLKFIKEKKLDNSLLNDIENLQDVIIDLFNIYIINSRQYRIKYNNENYLVSENAHKIIDSYKTLLYLQGKYKDNEIIKNALNNLENVIKLMLQDKQESIKYRLNDE